MGDGMGSLTLNGEGTVTVTASQTGNEAYEGATSVTRTITAEIVLGIEDAVDDFVLYPNPTSGKLHFSEQVGQFRLYGVEGRFIGDLGKCAFGRPHGIAFRAVLRRGDSKWTKCPLPYHKEIVADFCHKS